MNRLNPDIGPTIGVAAAVFRTVASHSFDYSFALDDWAELHPIYWWHTLCSDRKWVMVHGFDVAPECVGDTASGVSDVPVDIVVDSRLHGCWLGIAPAVAAAADTDRAALSFGVFVAKRTVNVVVAVVG